MEVCPFVVTDADGRAQRGLGPPWPVEQGVASRGGAEKALVACPVIWRAESDCGRVIRHTRASLDEGEPAASSM